MFMFFYHNFKNSLLFKKFQKFLFDTSLLLAYAFQSPIIHSFPMKLDVIFHSFIHFFPINLDVLFPPYIPPHSGTSISYVFRCLA